MKAENMKTIIQSIMSIDYEKGLHQELLQLQGDRLRSRAETSLIVAQYQWQEKRNYFQLPYIYKGL